MANIEASVSGDWHTGSNWVGGVVPTATDVAILNGKVMTLAGGASITCSRIEGGTALESLVNAIKAKTDQLNFTDGKVNAASESAPLVTVATAITDGLWSSATTWNTGAVPDASTFVYTNGKAVTVSNTVNCAGYADTPNGGDGVVVDEDGNAVLVNSFGDLLFSDVKVLAPLQGNIDNFGTATLTSPVATRTYAAAPIALFGRTQFAQAKEAYSNVYASVTFPMPVIDNSVGLTLEFWWYPTANNSGSFFSPSYLGNIPTYGGIEFFNISKYVQIGGTRHNLTGLAPTPLQWNHCAIQRTKAGAIEVYINGVRVLNQTNSPAIAAGNWLLFATQSGYYDGLLGYLSELRVTVSASGTRYTGNFAVPVAPFINYAPPPGTSLTGRLILQNNGAVIQSTVAPTVSVAGILSSLSRYTRAYIGQVGNDTGAIKAKTDQLVFSDGNVNANITSGDAISTYQSARYWRIYMTANNGSAYYALQEVQVIDADGVTVLTDPNTTVNASSFYNAGSYQASASKLVDGNEANSELGVWVSSGSSATEWASFDFTSPVGVSKVRMLPQASASLYASRSPNSYEIQWSDDNINWTTVKSITGDTSWTLGIYNVVTLDPISVQSGNMAEQLVRIEDKVNNLSPISLTVEAIKVKTDQLDFTANGVVTDSGTSATDYTDDLQQIKNLVVAGLN